MSRLKGAPSWRVTQVWPNAHSLQQQGTGHYKIVTGDRATGNQVIGEGTSITAAWRDAASKLPQPKE